MDYAVVAVPAAPMRRKPRHQREMVSQLLFGETVEVLKRKNNLWVKVRSIHDSYEGWMTQTQLKEIEEADAKKLPGLLTSGMFNTIIDINGVKMNVPIGSNLPGLIDGNGKIADLEYNFTGACFNRMEMTPNAERTTELTRPWLNAPYMWGGRTVFGVDCSGFVQVNYKMMGIDLSRDAWQQAQQGRTVKRLK
ncbi:MAG TPA: NlpC/P60 family protein, partial [Ferruginibacter sp.]|nr:NlpC/P60 family protein [Ferruginibacter sp.]